MPVNGKSVEPQESLTSEARTELLAILTDMDLSNPGPQPLKHRNPVATKNIGFQLARLTERVDGMIEDIWNNVIGDKRE